MLKLNRKQKIDGISSIFSVIKNYIYYINRWIYSLKEYNHLNLLYKEAERKSILNKVIVFNTVKPIRDFLDREFFIGKILALNGAKVKMLLDDGVLIHHETGLKDKYQILKKPIETILKRNIVKKALKTYKDPNLEINYYSQILKKVNLQGWKDLKKYALSSSIRFFQTSELDFNDKKVKEYFKLSLKNALLSRNVGEYVLNKIKPDYFLTSHGIYSTWGPAYDFLKRTAIKSMVFTRSLSHSLDRRDVYFTTEKAQTLSRCEFWQKYKNVKVTEEMKRKVEFLFESRIGHFTKDTQIYYNGNQNIFKINKKDGYKYHIAIFPSLIWDGDIHDRHLAFKNVLDWLTSTIDYFKNRNDVKIYLKFHPAEVTMFSNSAKIQDLIQEYLDTQKIKNLVLIPTEKNIDPYEFLKSGIDFGICYDGVLALEMPYLKIPVLLGGVGGRFSVKGGNFTINNREEYFNYLDNLKVIIKDFHENYDKYYENIVRYTYWYVFENPIKLPTLSKYKKDFFDLLKLKKEDITLNNKLKEKFN